jgi:cell wall-associated NlpC family hydrolase
MGPKSAVLDSTKSQDYLPSSLFSNLTITLEDMAAQKNRARGIRARRFFVALATIAGLLLAGIAVGPAWAVPDYPSAEEVAAAKRKVADKLAMIARLEKIILGLSAEADALATVAQVKAEIYNQAQDAVDAVASKVKTLETQVDAAMAEANQAQRQLGQLAAQMYRNGAAGTSLNLFLNADKADDLLYQLGASEKVAQQSDELYKKSIAKQQYAQSLADELAVAKAELATKAQAAKNAFAEAQSASEAMQTKVNANKVLNRTFYSQLATLKNTSAELERQRAEGLANEQAQQNGTADTTAPELYSVGDADDAKVEKMLAFAKAQLGEPYVLGGMGPNIWDCSGITKAAYAAAGIYIGTHSATNQFRTMAAAKKLIPLNQLQPGDLMWYTKEPGNFDGDKYHVVINLGNGMMLEAPQAGKPVRITAIRWGEMFKYAGRPSA